MAFNHNGPHSSNVLENKFVLKPHLRSFHKYSGIHQCFLIWDLFLGKKRIYAHTRALLHTIESLRVCKKSSYTAFVRYNCNDNVIFLSGL